MASTKVTLRTAFSDVFRVGDIEITRQGTELPSRKQADEVLEAARASGVELYEVDPEQPAAVKTTDNENERGDG